MKTFIICCCVLVIALSIPLIRRGGAPIIIIGIWSFIAALLYAAGPKPLGYMGLGEFLVFLFFGPVACAGTYYVQSYEINLGVILAGFAPGLLSAAVLIVNNIRDINIDRNCGKCTLAVKFGVGFSQMEYLFCIIGASLIPVLIYALIQDNIHILIASIISLIAIPNFKNLLTAKSETTFNKSLAFTGQLLVIYTVLFSIGWNFVL